MTAEQTDPAPAGARPVAVVVDSYTTANHLPPAFDRLGVATVHVQSTPELLTSMPAPNLDAYQANFVCDTPEDTAARLEALAPICVVAGQEGPGVNLADTLSTLLNVPSNGTSLSLARRDKFLMIEALRSAGLRCADQFRSSEPEDLVAWAEARGNWPVVVKPLRSAASNGVSVCSEASEIRKAAEEILGNPDFFGRPNQEVLVQSYLVGEEYKVDMVSYEGRRYTCGVWQYGKRLVGTRNIYDRDSLCPPDRTPVPEIIAYVDAALTALGIEFGPSHAEVIVTPDGPTLVEVGTRIAGGTVPDFHDVCLGTNQADVTALAYARPQEFLSRLAGRSYRMLRHASQYLVPTTADGVVASVDEQVVRQIEALETVFRLTVKLKAGDRIRPTVDLPSATMVVHMAGDHPAALERDHERIRQLKDRVYRIA
ncbi:ATP-grasp domain-containing protein [Streptomyces sp. NPDC006655]|uniref:ATP-grasp domain-containing protein n=1 Tax=Streptomyces sp. NPDC006655 TaxID=3156898 RepID=UPI0034517078